MDYPLLGAKSGKKIGKVSSIAANAAEEIKNEENSQPYIPTPII